jgi:hypothetical protein
MASRSGTTEQTTGSGTLVTLSGACGDSFERAQPTVFWLHKDSVLDTHWFAGHWWGVGLWRDVPLDPNERGEMTASSVVVLGSGMNSDWVQIVTHGCAEPAWRARRVWHWGDVEPVWALLQFCADMVRAKEEVGF